MPVFRQFNPAIHTPRQLVGAILKGNPANSSIKVTPGPAGVIYQGDPGATSFYDGSLNRLNIDEGILLTSGDGSPPLQNTRPDYRERLGEPGDPDFTQIAQNAFPGAGPSLDATTLQFSFAVEDPEIEAPHVRADLLFGSDEFPEFSNTDFVDVAGFLVNGINYAYFDKGNSPYYPKPLSVTDRSLNDGNFIDNDSAQFPNHADNLKELFQGETLTLPIEYDGVSSKLVQITGPVARQNNTIKVGVSDTGDRIYDSGVFVSNLEVVDSSVLPEGGALLLGLTGTEAQNDLTGTDVNEFIEAGAGKDFIQTGAGNDIVFAGPGNDVIRARQGQNGIDGGPGDEDTFVSPASFGQTRFNKNGELLIANSPDNQENQNLNRLANVEFLEFEGRTVSTSFLDTLSITNLDTAKSSKQEGDNGQTEFGFIVERPNNVVGKMEFNYEVTGRGKNPANAADFGGTFPRGTITFTGNQSRQQITIDVAGDTDIEPDELFSVAVTNADGSTVPRAPKASATILNDDNQQTPPPENAIAEIGSIDNLGDSPQTIQLEKDFENPVVIAEPASFRGSQPATVRISDVKSDSFVARIQETENQDGKHAVEDASYFVVEAGTWELDDGTLIEAGELNSRGLVTQDWDDVSFGADFDETPTVFSQIQTLNGAQYADTRQRRTDANGFQVGMEEEERLNEGGHARENIGWLAVSPGRGQWDGNDYYARTTGKQYDQTWNEFSFTNNIDSRPQLLAQIASYTGSDPANLRYRNLGANDVELKVQEDQSEDRETTHANESVSVFALEGEGVLTARPLAGIQSRSADVTAGDDSNNVIADESEIQTAEEGEVETASGGKVQDSETADTIDTKSADEEDDRLIGNKGKDRIFGGDGNDTLLGRQGSDRLLGGDGDDELSGGIGRDVLNGGNGDDILTGGASKDKVVFDNNQEFDGELGVDEITDFDPEMDSIILGKETFGAVESIEEDFAGVDSNSNIGTLEAAIIYNSSNGDIIYNANGSEPGLGSGGKFATLNGGPELDADNFTLR